MIRAFTHPSRLAWARGALLGGLGLLLLAGCKGTPPSTPDVDAGEAAERKVVPVPRVYFKDVTRESGISFVHYNGAFGKKLLPETMGSGVAVIDFDGDGLPDLLFVNSCPWPGEVAPGPAPTMALYRNKGDGTFEDVTAPAGLAVSFYGLGAAVGDYDNDG